MQARDGECARDEPDDDRQREGDQDGEREAVKQPPVTLVDAPRAERLRHERVESEQQSHPEEADGGEHAAAEARRADGLRAERPDHQRVDDAHAHPADFGEDDGDRELEQIAQLGPLRRARSRATRG